MERFKTVLNWLLVISLLYIFAGCKITNNGRVIKETWFPWLKAHRVTN